MDSVRRGRSIAKLDIFGLLNLSTLYQGQVQAVAQHIEFLSPLFTFAPEKLIFDHESCSSQHSFFLTLPLLLSPLWSIKGSDQWRLHWLGFWKKGLDYTFPIAPLKKEKCTFPKGPLKKRVKGEKNIFLSGLGCNLCEVKGPKEAPSAV